MGIKLLDVGSKDVVVASRVVAIVDSSSTSMRRYCAGAGAIDVTHGAKRRAVVVLDSGDAVVSAVEVRDLAARLGGDD